MSLFLLVMPKYIKFTRVFHKPRPTESSVLLLSLSYTTGSKNPHYNFTFMASSTVTECDFLKRKMHHNKSRPNPSAASEGTRTCRCSPTALGLALGSKPARSLHRCRDLSHTCQQQGHLRSKHPFIFHNSTFRGLKSVISFDTVNLRTYRI